MKKLLTLLFLFIGFQHLNAKCGVEFMKFYPMEKVISQNAMFVIEASGRRTITTITSFKHRKVYLESKSGDIVELQLQEVLYSKKNLAQAIFKPSRALLSNTKYFLKYENQTEQETIDIKKRYQTNHKRKKLYWITNSTATISELSSNSTITHTKSVVTPFGCGPAVFAIFDISTKQQQETWHRTELLDVSTNTKSVYYIQPYNNKISVGHNMCSGAFSFNRKGIYKVRFRPINSDGKASTATDWITFKSPFQEMK